MGLQAAYWGDAKSRYKWVDLFIIAAVLEKGSKAINEHVSSVHVQELFLICVDLTDQKSPD